VQIGSTDAEAAATGAEQLVAACHQARQFTDIANFTLRCGVCQIGIKGEKEAVEHAKATGHQNFAEY
jgi:ubiquitin thioesterase OTU1